VFIGGAIAPLLQTHPPFPRARVTSDVDGVIASQKYADYEVLRRELEARGFRQTMDDTKHVNRWIAPCSIPVDIMPAGDHLGGSGNPWDAMAIDTAVTLALDNEISILHVNAPSFLAQKWAAHQDRGAADPLRSHDLEDILALLASRPGIVGEVLAAPLELRRYVAAHARDFLKDPNAEDLLAAHLNNSQEPAATIKVVREILREIASGP